VILVVHDAFTPGVAMVAVYRFFQKVDSCGYENDGFINEEWDSDEGGKSVILFMVLFLYCAGRERIPR
jgi:hypothetical protein